MRRNLSGALLALLLSTGSVAAADVARLEWGLFVIDTDSSGGFLDYKSASSDDGRTVTMTFATLEAKADGSVTDARADMSGRYEISQPPGDTFSSCRIELAGHVIKGLQSTVRLAVRIGEDVQTVEWTGAEAHSGRFTRSVEIALPPGGRIPNPLVVGLEIAASKGDGSDGAYVSVETMVITAQHSQVAAR